MEQKLTRGKREEKKKNQAQALARQRAEVILQVRSGTLTAKQGAERLGISRKTYYEWEDRSLRAMALALENRSPGRPPLPVDPQKEELRERIKEIEKKLYLAEKTIEVKEMLSAYEAFQVKKKERINRKSGKRS